MAAPFLATALILTGALSFSTSEAKEVAPPVVTKLTQADINHQIDIQAPKYGLSPSLVKKISLCEDKGNPYSTHANKHGTTTWSTDIGPLQINDYYHESEMKAEGLNISKPLDNLKFGLEMMSKQGTTPWNWSKYCWNK